MRGMRRRRYDQAQSSRPDFLILAYPVITMLDPYVHKGSRTYLLGDAPTQAQQDAMSAELHVTPQTPPAFLFTTTDDHTVPVMNSVMFYSALVKAGVPAEMHMFQHGGHGSGLGAENPQLSVWPDLLIKWMRERGYAAATYTGMFSFTATTKFSMGTRPFNFGLIIGSPLSFLSS